MKKWLISGLIFILILSFPLNTFAESESDIYNSLKDNNRILKERKFISEESPTVYLTFDDGPSDLTAQILDILKEEQVSATFFVLGQSAEKKPDILKRIKAEGHGIGNHTYSHQYSKLYLSFSDYWQEIQTTEKIIYDSTGDVTSLIRTPGGTYKNWDSFYFYYMDQADYLVFDWNVDSGDSKRKGISVDEIITNIKNSKLDNRLIVLLHDSAGHENTVKALPAIIEYYREKGYQFKPLSESVEPIIQSSTKIMWSRVDEFIHKDNFIRVLSEVEEVDLKTEEQDTTKNIVDNSLDIDEETELSPKKTGEELNNNKMVDLWLTTPYYQKVTEAFYYEDDELWISIVNLQKIVDVEVEADNNLNKLKIANDELFFQLNFDQPFYLSNNGSLRKYQGLKQINEEWYVPLLPIIQAADEEVYWNKEMGYLIFGGNNYRDTQPNIIDTSIIEVSFKKIMVNIIEKLSLAVNWLLFETSKTFFTYPSLLIYNNAGSEKVRS